MATVLMTMIENAQGCTFSVWHISVSTKLHITVCGLVIARDWTGFTFMLLLLVCQQNILFHHAALLLFFFLAVDPVRFLVVFPVSEILSLCCALPIYACQLKVHEMHL